MVINAFVMGSGRAAQALKEALRVLELADTAFRVASITNLVRGQSLHGLAHGVENPVLFIANPHGLHAKALLEADRQGFALIVVEKPAAVNLAEIDLLRMVKSPVAVCHGYRQMWGLQAIRRKIIAGEFGKLIAIEGRYWQSSAAQNAEAKNYRDLKTSSWKNDPALGGLSDTLIDIASHWVDAATYLAGEAGKNLHRTLSYVNAESPHRDTHVQLSFGFDSGTRAMASVSKTIHGAGNHFEINVIGEKQYAAWRFAEPDLLEIGQGATRSFFSRTAQEPLASVHSPHHGLGWLEGYAAILKAAIGELGSKQKSYPTLSEHLDVMQFLLSDR